MRIIECDRCHKRIENTTKAGYVNLDWRDIRTGQLEGSAEYDDWDLCDECKKAVEDFLHMRAVPEVETKKKAADRQRTDQGTAPGRVECEGDS